jgi:hypothetical protein
MGGPEMRLYLGLNRKLYVKQDRRAVWVAEGPTRKGMKAGGKSQARGSG